MTRMIRVLAMQRHRPVSLDVGISTWELFPAGSAAGKLASCPDLRVRLRIVRESNATLSVATRLAVDQSASLNLEFEMFDVQRAVQHHAAFVIYRTA